MSKNKDYYQTAAIIAAIVSTAWLVGGTVQVNSAEIAALRESNGLAITGLRGDMRELRGLLIAHINGHNHLAIIDGEPEE